MRTRYDILVSLKVEHNYFTDKNFDDFELTPDEMTKKLISRLGLLVKKSRNNWFLLYQSEGPWKTNIDDLVNQEFVFIFNISDSSFEQYTNSEFIPKPGAIQFYASTIDTQFFSSSRFVELPEFDYSIQHTERPVNIKLKKFRGDILKDIAVVEAATKKYSFNVSETGEQAYDISENTLPITDERKREIFVYKKYKEEHFYGMIYFRIFPQANENSNKYHLLFNKK